MALVIIIGVGVSCAKRMRRRAREAEEEEDFVIGGPGSHGNGTGGAESMRSVTSNVGPLVTSHNAGFTALPPDALSRQQSHNSYGYDNNPFEGLRTGAVPPSVAAAKGYPRQQHWHAEQQEYYGSYPAQRQPTYPQGHPYQEEYTERDAYPTQYSGYQHQYNTHTYPNSHPAGAAQHGAHDPFDDQSPGQAR